MDIYAVNITSELEVNLYEKFFSFVAEDKARRILRLINRKDKIRTLIGDILIRSAACDHLQISNEDIQFEYNHYGKPRLKDWHQFHFNVSHSGDWVVAAVDERPIGIDIERVNSIDCLGIAERFFSKTEYQWLRTQDLGRRLDCFYKLWTLKESYLKIIGAGLSIPLDSFSFIIKKNDDIHIDVGIDKREDKYLRLFSIDNNHIMSICSENDPATSRIVFRNYGELYNKIIRVAKVEGPAY
ncbi:4'-phosphopantetheinyl transferase family protein [Peribacillus sp. NPDC006672]|uniref:4'-phosphopantetheinyl transferase family protein n=1 Tax=unclassified Peribacillus TaxID=2675266 RepID=UPI003D05BE7F